MTCLWLVWILSRGQENLSHFAAQIAFAHSFSVILFRLDKLWTQGSRTSRRAKDLLPAHLLRHLRHVNTTVLVSGSHEGYHFGPIRIVDFQHLFTIHRHHFMYSNRDIALGDNNKCDVPIIGMLVNDYCHKPIKEELAKSWFGGLRGYNSRLD